MANNVTREEHLEALANAIKDYADSKLATIGGGSAATINNFTGASASAAGLSGLVPAPQAGDNEKFLRGDGQWVTLSGGSTGGSDIELVLSNTPSTVNGAMWLASVVAVTAGEAITLSTLMPATVVNGSMWLEI